MLKLRLAVYFFVPIVVFNLFLVCLASASDVTVKVTDQQSRVIPGARVVLYREASTVPTAVQNTGADGAARFSSVQAGSAYRANVAAPSFAPASINFHVEGPNASLEVTLNVAAPPQTVVVSATGTPLPEEESGASVGQLNSTQLRAMQPVAAADAVRFMPGATMEDAGQRGGISSLFVRGGDSRYNKVFVDGVPVNEPGGTFDFGTVPMDQVERVEMLRGAASALYGSDAMTSVVQFFTRTGSTRVPELRFGADGGTFETAHGYASLAGARGRFDYNLFGDQFNTNGQGVNDAYSNSSQGVNVGVQIAPSAFFRFHARHSNERTGVQSFWLFNGQELVPPDTDQFARQNNFLSDATLSFKTGARWQHRVTTFEYNHKRTNVDSVIDPGRGTVFDGQFSSFDLPFSDFANINRAGVDYQGEYWARDWARTTFGYYFEDENGWVGDRVFGTNTHGLRRNHAVYGQEVLVRGRASAVVGLRFEHNESFGNKAIPRVAASYLVARGGQTFSGTRLRAAYSTGVKEPRFEESFGIGGFNIDPNPNLKAEENRSWEAGVEQAFFGGKMSAGAAYFNNHFRNQIDFVTLNFATFEGQYINVNKSLAHGAELDISARPMSRLTVDAAYTYLSTQILEKPLCAEVFCNPLQAPGAPFVRRPKHSGTLIATWNGTRWGAQAAASAVGRRPDSDFLGLQPPVTYAAGYARVDFSAWRTINRYMTAYVNLGNAFNRHYEEVAGYPALRANFRAGMRFRIGGE